MLMERSQAGHDEGDWPPPGLQVKPGAQFGHGCSSEDHKVTRHPVAPETNLGQQLPLPDLKDLEHPRPRPLDRPRTRKLARVGGRGAGRPRGRP